MQEFVWDGVTYLFDANKCYDGLGLILLPDGRVIQVDGWFEVYPPRPMILVEVVVTTASKKS
jgi:hypothetical protein